MHHSRPAQVTSPVFTLNRSYVAIVPMGLIVCAIGLGIALMVGVGVGGFRRFSMSYLTTFCFLLSISLGGLFFVLSQHLCRAGWSVSVRRIAEILAMCTFPLLLVFLPILLPLLMNSSAVYWWNEQGWAHDDRIQELKDAYLNKWFFAARVIFCFVCWGLMARFFLRNSLRQDETGDGSLSRKMQRHSTWMTILFAVTIAIAAFDLEMSLQPWWFSTMFPVYFFAGSFMGGLCTIMLIALLLQRSGRVTDEITVEHYHDLAKLTFGFIFFWGYIAFSQFMLIWYANIPEETFWFNYRINKEGWATVSLILVFGRLLIPFLGMMARTVRRSKTYLLFASIYLLVMHWVDHFWLVMPELNRGGHEFAFSLLIDVPLAIGLVGIFVTFFAMIARNRPLVPLKDPRLGEALNYHNP